VRGAYIKGEGFIEVMIITNTGRTFIYKQESVNGEFIVPYSTIENTYDVKAISKYKVSSTGMEYDVTEKDVRYGLTVV
jgi:dolichyl-diphosphooligosaccharide--protein glycosyltransferase